MFYLHRWGFSLLEIIVVLALLAVISVVAIPTFGNYLAERELEAACLQLQQDIRLASQQALVGESATYRINLYRNAEKYRVLDMSKPSRYREVAMPPGVDLAWTNFENDVIYFSARGRPTAGGHITLKSGKTGKFLYVIVAPVTGRTRVSEQPPSGVE